ncbi:hypothetical protein M413DRAFT_441452 [Hebeloma cylindrosporum]|uniref:Uncharacterized protein n=1 Tax=Hebeloma cylindrosporum TaxID=76867 RepID=A0A0C3CC38_HEBCY|nr:hypothetical protein M413DRAFT_441452 [Hebeloma cylindrosporum h7]
MDTKPTLGDGEIVPMRQADVWKASHTWYDAFVNDPQLYTSGCRTISSGQQGRVHVPIIIMDSRQDGAHH